MGRPIAFAALLLAIGIAAPVGTLAAEAAASPDPYIVVLEPGPPQAGRSGPNTAAIRARDLDLVATRNTVEVDRRFENLLSGFSTQLTPGEAQALAADPDVQAVVPDERTELTAQSMPTGVARVGRTSPQANIDGEDDRVEVDLAVVDTGIDASHPDLNVVGGVNCSTANRSAWGDDNGHGTHVAGTVGAKDNDIGVVGVAPGARLWAVRILNADGEGLLSWYICGLDWIVAQRDASDPSRPLIEAVNMSVAKWGHDDGACGATNADILHAAICRLVDSGVTVVAAAANDSGPASLRVPAAYDEVITVSALNDSDGRPGGVGGNNCFSWGTWDVDDTFADFSNYGPDIDLIAPGKCIWSTKVGNTYGWNSGTSMAAPHVTGAAGLYLASRPYATPAEVKRALQYLGSTNWASETDPDGVPDRLLDVNRIGRMGSVSMSALPADVSVIGDGEAARVTLTLSRATVLEEVTLSVTGMPAGMTAGLDQAALFGFEATTATVTVTALPSVPPGTYALSVGADWHGTLATATFSVTVARPPGGVFRQSGANRYATAAAISAATFSPGVAVAYVATGADFPDALAGAAAAGHVGAPLLLVSRDSVPTTTAAELARLQPGRIVILGGSGAVGDGVAGTLSFYTPGGVFRQSGANRYATAAAISAATFSPGVAVAYVATGADFPDALAGAAAAGHVGAPLLLVSRDSVPTTTAAELARLQPGRIVILGGSGAVGDGVAGTLSFYTPGGVFRQSGANRYATAAAISAATFSPGVAVAYVATGADFPDALAGAAAAGHVGAPLLLVSRDSVPTATAAELARLQPGRIVILGGSGAVGDGVAGTLSFYLAE